VGGLVISSCLWRRTALSNGLSWELANGILKAHFAAIVGLPAGAAVSFILVVLLRQTEGPIEFEGLDLQVSWRIGAGGNVGRLLLGFCWRN